MSLNDMVLLRLEVFVVLVIFPIQYSLDFVFSLLAGVLMEILEVIDHSSILDPIEVQGPVILGGDRPEVYLTVLDDVH